MLKIDDHIPGARIIGLDRAEKRNAIGVELTLALEQILLETRFREDIRILVFHGIGGHFSAGESFWVGTENERKLAKTLGGRAYITTSDGRGGFKVCKLPEVQPGGKGRKL